jgi:hypothetical protein
MGRREKRQAQRDQQKLKRRREKESSKTSLAHRLTTIVVKNLWSLVVAGLTLLGGYAIFRPHISVEPQITLNPVDPYTTQFNLKNENAMFSIYNVDAVCWPRNMDSGNGFSVVSLGPLPNVHHEIALLESGASSTVDCPSAIGGLGRWSGAVLNADLELVISYRQSWWPFAREERYPFAARRDTQGSVHWVHITPREEKPFSEILGPTNKSQP